MPPAKEQINLSISSPIVRMAENAASRLGVDLEEYTQLAWTSFMSSTNQVSTMIPSTISDKQENLIEDESPFVSIRLDEVNDNDVNQGESNHVLIDKILWGQFNRYLPIKFTLRILHSLCTEGELPTLVRWQEAVKEMAPGVQKHLREVDESLRIRRGSQVASSFPRIYPKDKERTLASMNRFLNHYTAVIQSDGSGPVVGMLAELGLIEIDLNTTRVSLTSYGLNYSNLENPQIDHSEPTKQSMSEQEARFMLDHISFTLTEEWQFLLDVMQWVSDGHNEPTSLKEHGKQMRGPGTKQNWSEKELPTYINGALGRLTEMGLIHRKWDLRRVTYLLSEKASKLLIEEVV